jgi:hypothetical protein
MRLLLLAMSFAFIMGCVSTGYKASGAKGTPSGYVDTKLSMNTYHVRYIGTEDQAEIVYGLFLRRSSEVTLQEGYKYFIVKSDDHYQRGLSSINKLPMYEADIEMTNKNVQGAFDAAVTFKEAVPQKLQRH